MAVSAPSFFLSRIADLSLHPPKPPPLRFFVPPPSLSSSASLRPSSPPATSLCCLVSGVDGGGVYDESVSTRKSTFDRGFAVIANMLKRIEPLDTSVISQGVSDLAKDSMKQTISTMLGLLPSDQFSVTIAVSKRPLDRLLFSSIITGYTLWSVEYRMSLMRNLDISPSIKKESICPIQTKVSEMNNEDKNVDIAFDLGFNDLESCSPRVFGDLSPEALNYIHQLQSELTYVKKELNDRKEEIMQMEHDRGSRNNLLEYLRSLDPDMVIELSQPSSIGVEEIIHQLVQNILRRFIGDNAKSKFMELSAERNIDDHSNDYNELCDTVGTSRDYLAKLLFWCMLLGHHLRGLENRLSLSCAVGLL